MSRENQVEKVGVSSVPVMRKDRESGDKHFRGLARRVVAMNAAGYSVEEHVKGYGFFGKLGSLLAPMHAPLAPHQALDAWSDNKVEDLRKAYANPVTGEKPALGFSEFRSGTELREHGRTVYNFPQELVAGYLITNLAAQVLKGAGVAKYSIFVDRDASPVVPPTEVVVGAVRLDEGLEDDFNSLRSVRNVGTTAFMESMQYKRGYVTSEPYAVGQAQNAMLDMAHHL